MKAKHTFLIAGTLLLSILNSGAQPCISINAQPQAQSSCIGSPVTLVVAAVGAEPLAYQWQRSVDQVSYADLLERTNGILLITNFQTSDMAYYRVIITNAECSVTSQVAFLMALWAPTISAPNQPTNWPKLDLGATTGNRVIAGGSSPVFQWRRNGTNLAGQTRYSITLTNLQLSDAGDYDVVVTNVCGAVTSRVARLDITVPGATFTRVTNGPVVTDPSSYWGCAWVDYDNDGLLDLFATTGGNTGTRTFRNRLYRNTGGGKFIAMTAAQVGAIAGDMESWYGCSWGDYDNDGFLDVFLPNWAGANALYRNNGAGGFARVLNAGAIVSDFAPAQSGPWGDYDNDGYLDLFLASGWPPSKIALYHNQGGTNFTRVSEPPLGTAPWAATEVATWGDYDNDGDLDLVFSDTQGGPRIKRYENRGQGVFAQITSSVWNGIVQGIIPIWADYDNDGRLDLLWHNPARLLHNDGNDQWTVKQLPTATGACQGMWADYDNDGDLDLFFCGGQGSAYRNQIFQNDGDGTFAEMTTVAPATFTGQTSTCAWGDYDNDGFQDLVVVPFYSSTTLLYHNDGNTNSWISIRLVGTVANRAAIGAKVRVQATIFGRRQWQMREISAGNRAQNDLRAHFGLGDATSVEALRIEWPSGRVTELHNVAASQFLTITEPPLLRCAGITGEDFCMTLTGNIGSRYEVLMSSNVVDWVVWQTVTNTTRIMTLVDPGTAKHSHAFFQARLAP